MYTNRLKFVASDDKYELVHKNFKCSFDTTNVPSIKYNGEEVILTMTQTIPIAKNKKAIDMLSMLIDSLEPVPELEPAIKILLVGDPKVGKTEWLDSIETDSECNDIYYITHNDVRFEVSVHLSSVTLDESEDILSRPYDYIFILLSRNDWTQEIDKWLARTAKISAERVFIQGKSDLSCGRRASEYTRLGQPTYTVNFQVSHNLSDPKRFEPFHYIINKLKASR
jgi:hypothetical protein